MNDNTNSNDVKNGRKILIDVDRSDLIFLRRAIDDAVAEIQAGVADGDIDEKVLFALDESLHLIEGYLG